MHNQQYERCRSVETPLNTCVFDKLVRPSQTCSRFGKQSC